MYNTPLDQADFDRHYQEIHVPLVRKLPGMRRYTLSKNAVAVHGEAYYLIAEMEWDDLAAMQAAFASPEGVATAEDVPTFATGGVRSIVFELQDVL